MDAGTRVAGVRSGRRVQCRRGPGWAARSGGRVACRPRACGPPTRMCAAARRVRFFRRRGGPAAALAASRPPPPRRTPARPALLAPGSSELRAQFVLRRIASGEGRVPRAELPASCSRSAWPDPRGARGRWRRPDSSRSTNPPRRSEKPQAAKVSGRTLQPTTHRDGPARERGVEDRSVAGNHVPRGRRVHRDEGDAGPAWRPRWTLRGRWRRGRDSNPRWVAPYRISSAATAVRDRPLASTFVLRDASVRPPSSAVCGCHPSLWLSTWLSTDRLRRGRGLNPISGEGRF